MSNGNNFTAENIVRILKACEEGGTYRQILARSGVNISTHSLTHWLSLGRKAKEAGKETAYVIFLELWQARHPGHHRPTEALKRKEIRKALRALGEDEMLTRLPTATEEARPSKV